VSLLPPDHMMTDEDLLEYVESSYARTSAYVKIYEGRRDLAIANNAGPAHLLEHEEDLRLYRRAMAQQWRTIQLLRFALDSNGAGAYLPSGAKETSPELEEVEIPAPVNQDLAGLLGLDDLE